MEDFWTKIGNLGEVYNKFNHFFKKYFDEFQNYEIPFIFV